MHTFYIMAVVAAVAIIIALVLVLGSNRNDTPAGSSTDTTAAVSGSVPDCDKLAGNDRNSCLEQRKRSGGK